jgi:hypothetical protein
VVQVKMVDPQRVKKKRKKKKQIFCAKVNLRSEPIKATEELCFV